MGNYILSEIMIIFDTISSPCQLRHLSVNTLLFANAGGGKMYILDVISWLPKNEGLINNVTNKVYIWHKNKCT
jgi:hypothetical protein